MNKNELIKIVKRAQADDKEAFEQLFINYSKSVYFSAYKILANEQSAQDVTQEVFAAVYLGIKSLKNPSAFSSWIMKIAAYQCGHYLRSSKETLLPEAELEENSNCYINVSSEDLPEQNLENSDEREIISKIIDTLPTEQKSVIVMFYFNELNVKDIARCLNVSESAVKSRLQYARQKIKKEVLETENKNKIRLHGFSGGVAAAFAAECDALKVQLPINAAAAGGTSAAAASFAAKAVAVGIAVKTAGVITAVAVGGAAATAVAVPVVQQLSPQIIISEIALSDMQMQINESANANFEITVLVNKTPYTFTNLQNSYVLPAQLGEQAQKKLDNISFTLNAQGDAVAVEGLLLNAVQNGSAEVTLTASLNNQAVAAKAKVNVITPVSSIQSVKRLELTVGENANLSAKVLPENASDKTVLYESAHPDIAKVDENGTVTAIKAGTAQVKAICKNIFAICEITVAPKAESIELTAAKTNLTVGESLDLSIAIKPEGCKAKVVFTSDNEAVLSVEQNGKVTANATGKAIVTAKIEGYDIFKSVTFTVKAKQSAAVVSSDISKPNTAPAQSPALDPGHYHGNGSDFGHCPICGQVYNQTNLPATEGNHTHNWVYVKSTEADCMAWGVDIFQCDCSTVVFPLKYPPTAHTFSEWQQKTAPTATEAGLSSRFCTNCLHEETQTIAPTG